MHAIESEIRPTETAAPFRKDSTVRTACTLLVVSHGQGALVGLLLEDIKQHCQPWPELVVVINIREDETYLKKGCGLKIKVIRNTSPRGFGQNQNAAASEAKTDVIVVANPDIRLTSDPLPTLETIARAEGVAICAPMVLSPEGKTENNARRFPTALRLLMKIVGGNKGPDYVPVAERLIDVDWVAGMFLACRRDVFRALGGFDERYFMYYEDVDLSQRATRNGMRVVLVPSVSVVHCARRASHRHPKYFLWHVRSAIRFLWKEKQRLASKDLGGRESDGRTREKT